MLKSFSEIFAELQSRGTKKRMIAAWGVDSHTIAAAAKAVELGLADVTLVGDENMIAEACKEEGVDIARFTIVHNPVELAAVGTNALQIKQRLEETALDSSIYITVEDLKYLKKGGRITPAAAALGTVLNLKPVLTIQGAKLDAHAKVRGMKMARKAMIDALRKDLDTRFADLYQKGEMRLEIAYSGVDEELAKDWQKQLSAAFPGHTFDMAPLSLSVSCHIGPGALAVACTRKVGRK